MNLLIGMKGKIKWLFSLRKSLEEWKCFWMKEGIEILIDQLDLEKGNQG